jgi:hypothetical protein
MADEDLDEVISLRISRDDRAMLDRLAKRVPIKPLTIARIAMRLGLAELDRNPAAFFESEFQAAARKVLAETKPKKKR